MNFFKRFFRKKRLADYLILLSRRTSRNFQIDIYRNGQVDMQIGRQRLLKNFGLDFDDPKGFSVFLTFNQEKIGNEANYQRFKDSSLYRISNNIKTDLLGETFIINTSSDFIEIIDLVNKIQTEVYQYNSDTLFAFKYIKHGSSNG